ncbi:MAG: ATP-binding protein [Myxococcota bacterium]
MSARRTRTPGIRATLLIAALAPTLLFAVGDAAVLWWGARTRSEFEVRTTLESQSAFLIEGVRLGLLTGSREQLEDPVRAAMTNPDVVAVSIYDADGSPLLEVQRENFQLPEHPPPLQLRDGMHRHQLGPKLSALDRVARYPVADQDAELLSFAALPSASPRLGEPEGWVRITMSTDRIETAANQTLVTGMAVLAVVVAIALGLVFMLSRGGLSAIRELLHAVERMSQGSLDVEVPPLAGVEMAQLGLAFNSMSSRLRETTAELEEYSQTLEAKVNERTAEAERARVEAERANRAKSDFLANMSHEIRTPMTAILGYTDLLIDVEEGLPPEARKWLAVIDRNGSHLLSILNDILDISKIEAGRLDLERIPLDLVAMVGETSSLMRVRAEERGLELSVVYETPIPERILTDPTRVRQALVNLVGNAIKFTERGSVKIHIAYDETEKLASLRVVDTGIGIDPERVATLFRPFEQADNSVTRQFGGTGLGLSITKRLAALLGGDCRVESELGVGSAFTFSFSAPPAAGARMTEIEGESEVLVPLRAEPLPRAERLRARILYAEDGPDNQRLISHILRKAGGEVTVVENGRLAVEAAERAPYDLILMDMAMPVMDGYTATATLRELGVEIPIIALTAHALDSERERCLSAGCTEYLTKPVNRNRLIETIHAVLSDRNAGDKLRRSD